MHDDLERLTEGLGEVNIIGSGGNINKLYRLAEKKDKKKLRLPVTSLQTLYDKLVPLTPEQRMDTFSLKVDRADVIVPAAEIFLTIAKVVRSEYIHVPVIGLADGIIDSLYENKEGKINFPLSFLLLLLPPGSSGFSFFGLFFDVLFRFLLFHFPSQSFQPPFIPEHKLFPSVEVLLENDTDALRCQIGPCVIAVVRLIIRFQSDISATVHKPFCFKVTYKVCICHRIVAVSEVTIDKQTIVQ